MATVPGALRAGPTATVGGVRIRIVQASVPQRDKWRGEKQGAIFQDQLGLSRRDPSGRRDDLAGITHLIWPEAAMPFLPLQHPEALATIGELLPQGTQLISGALRLKNPELGFSGHPEGYNSLMVFRRTGSSRRFTTRSTSCPSANTCPSSARSRRSD